MSVRFIFHVGLSKAGSSYIHYILKSNLEFLKIRGCHYPISEPESETDGNGLHLFNKLLPHLSSFEEFGDVLRAELSNYSTFAESINCNTVIISSEFFVSYSVEFLETFANSLSNIEFDFKVVLVTRNPYDWYFSSWLQAIKCQGCTFWIDELLNESTNLFLFPLLSESIFYKSIGTRLKLIDYDVHKHELGRVFFETAMPFVATEFDDIKIHNVSSQINQSIDLIGALTMYTINKHSKNSNVSNTLQDYVARTVPVSAPKFFFYNDIVFKKIQDYCLQNNIPCDNKYKGRSSCTKEDIFGVLDYEQSRLLSTIKLLSQQIPSVCEAINASISFRLNQFKNSVFNSGEFDEIQVAVYLSLNHDVLFSTVDPFQHFVEYISSGNKNRYISFV